MNNWKDRIEFLKKNGTVRKEWVTARVCGTSRSAIAFLEYLRQKYPEFAWRSHRSNVLAWLPFGEALQERAARKAEEGDAKYGSVFYGDPIDHLKDELADGYNYVQYAQQAKTISEEQRDDLLLDLHKLHSKAAAFGHSPDSEKLAGLNHKARRRFDYQPTVQEKTFDVESKRPTDPNDE